MVRLIRTHAKTEQADMAKKSRTSTTDRAKKKAPARRDIAQPETPTGNSGSNSGGGASGGGGHDALDGLLDEIGRTYQLLVDAAERVHAPWGITPGRRGVLRVLHAGGPMTVPAIARGRCVSRQFVQGLVNDLLEADLVKLIDNPAHQRSSLVSLTAQGATTAQAMKKREERVMEKLPLAMQDKRLQDATEVLRSLREALDGPWLDKALTAAGKAT
jgi:DNA-binding MarR family transcriptional regulator